MTENTDPTAAPLHAGDVSGVASALIITASHDPLLDDGIKYGDKLRTAGVPATHTPVTPARFTGFGISPPAPMPPMKPAPKPARREAFAGA